MNHLYFVLDQNI